jgi:two-component system sensor histidine kinase/response regulator
MESLIHLVQSSDLSENEFKELVDDLHSKVRDVSGFLLNILMWAKSQIYGFTSEAENIYPRNLVDEIVSVFQTEIDTKKLKIINNINVDSQVYADPSLAKLIVRNILTNAIKFSYEVTDVEISALPVGEYLRFTIEDKGVGISPDRQKQLLTGAVQSLNSNGGGIGTGLGLMLCKEFVDMHNGEMGIDSVEGKGTRVWFTLPLTKPDVEA